MVIAIITSLISGLCVAVPSIIATISSTKSNIKLFTYRLDKLEDKVTKHNNLIDRMYKIESRVTLAEDNIKDIQRK